jgi:hypothetical protein
VILYGASLFYFMNEDSRLNPPELKARYGLDPKLTSSEFLAARAKAEAIGGTVAGMRKDEFIGGAIHQVVYNDKRELKEVRIIPIERQSTGLLSERGRALVVEPNTPMSKHVLERAQERSKPYGTKVEIDNGIGYIRVR